MYSYFTPITITIIFNLIVSLLCFPFLDEGSLYYFSSIILSLPFKSYLIFFISIISSLSKGSSYLLYHYQSITLIFQFNLIFFTYCTSSYYFSIQVSFYLLYLHLPINSLFNSHLLLFYLCLPNTLLLHT